MKTKRQLDAEVAAAMARPALFRLGDPPRDMREELFNLHAAGVNPEATERKFYARSVPLIDVDISGCDLSDYSKSSTESYDLAKTPPIAIADGALIDGGHRAAAAQYAGISMLRAIDMSGLIDPRSTGFVALLRRS